MHTRASAIRNLEGFTESKLVGCRTTGLVNSSLTVLKGRHHEPHHSCLQLGTHSRRERASERASESTVKTTHDDTARRETLQSANILSTSGIRRTDVLIPAEAITSTMAQYCEAGVPVTFDVVSAPDHLSTRIPSICVRRRSLYRFAHRRVSGIGRRNGFSDLHSCRSSTLSCCRFSMARGRSASIVLAGAISVFAVRALTADKG